MLHPDSRMDLRQLLKIRRIIRHLSWPRALSPKRLMTSQNSRFILAVHPLALCSMAGEELLHQFIKTAGN